MRTGVRDCTDGRLKAEMRNGLVEKEKGRLQRRREIECWS